MRRSALAILAVATIAATLGLVAGPASASSLRFGAIDNPNGPGVMYADDNGYCPGVAYSSGQPIGQVSSCRTNPSPLRVEIYPIPLGGTWDPFTSPAGGLAVEAANGVNVGNLALPSAASGGFKLTGNIVSGTPVADGRLHVNAFQLLGDGNPAVGAFGSFFANHDNTWTTGWVFAGSYILFIEDRATGNNIEALVDLTPTTNIDLDLDATCFGLDTCAYDSGGPASPGGGFHPLAPSRLLDTRYGVGITNGPIQAGDGRNSDPNPAKRADSIANHELKVTGVGGVPNIGVSAVLINVTAVDPTDDGFLAVYPKLARGVANPSDPIRVFNEQSAYLPNYPNSSNLNFAAGDIVPNLVLARVGAGGKIRFNNYFGLTNTVADVVGWFDTGPGNGDGFVGITPTRILDTRDGTGKIGGRFNHGDSRTLTVAPSANGAVPRDATAVVLNVTAANPTNEGYVTVWPHGIARPLASDLNTQPGQTRPNLVAAKVGDNGAVDLYTYCDQLGSVDLVADAVGYFKPGAGKVFGVDPQRLFDSRTGLNTVRSAFGPGEARAIQVAGQAGVPGDATAVVLNVTVTEPTFAGFVTVWPAGAPMPLASTLNFVAGQTVPNLVMVKLGDGGQVSFLNSAGSSHLLADVVGYVR
ncbi:MAG TPA: hypothetical protein VKD67_03015 [Acidimicrobiales bacterium]|nr:hypothetical protein [Acidimicrobiales bacterium]